ncbi:hypothetical protein MPEAHAMD_7287 [Methylobacterium frigidaeris]|uniref:Uncharacterized protein n=1 Tax=Methylobacterium frigidaeris TaxID=2038277 RepID=A0AA37HKZ5_9HYPH|nr:hypothetical protein MPEAHAMD_7287 [Methylobacterium frigidaeris]
MDGEIREAAYAVIRAHRRPGHLVGEAGVVQERVREPGAVGAGKPELTRS